MYGDSDGWQWTSFSETFPAGATSGTLIMGLQNSHGRVEFDLSTLQVGTLFTPEQRVNLDWKVRYPAEIAGHCRLRGVMSPHTFTDDDLMTLLALARKGNARLAELQREALVKPL